MSKGITFFKEDREPTPDNPNGIISAIVDDEVADYINRLEKHKNIVDELEKWLKYEWYEMSNEILPNEVLDKLNELKGVD